MTEAAVLFIDHEPEWRAALGDNWWRHIFTARLTDRLHSKQGRSIARWTVRRDARNLTVFVKRHFRYPLWRQLLVTWLHWVQSDARKEWHHLRVMNQVGIPTPKPIAVAEVFLRFQLRSVLVVEELSDQIALHEAIPEASRTLDALHFQQWKTGLITEVARLVRELHWRNFFHRDLYLCHFFIPRKYVSAIPNNWSGKVTLIDFHRLTHRRFLTLPLRIKDLAQLEFSTHIEGMTDEDRDRFWESYTAEASSRFLRLLVRMKSVMYRTKNRARNHDYRTVS